MYDIFSGLGPYKKNTEGKFEYNLDSLTKNTNVLYIDSPAGIGYSHAQRKIDLHSNDFSASSDLLNFLVTFFNEYSYLSTLPLFISGHS